MVYWDVRGDFANFSVHRLVGCPTVLGSVFWIKIRPLRNSGIRHFLSGDLCYGKSLAQDLARWHDLVAQSSWQQKPFFNLTKDATNHATKIDWAHLRGESNFKKIFKVSICLEMNSSWFAHWSLKNPYFMRNPFICLKRYPRHDIKVSN